MFINNFEFAGNKYYFYDLKKLFIEYPKLKKLPNSLKLLLESNLRNKSDKALKKALDTFVSRNDLKHIEYYPNRVIMGEYNGLLSLLDLVSFRQSAHEFSKQKDEINPKILFDLILDYDESKFLEEKKEKYSFIKWSQSKFKNFSVVPPANEVYKQVNLEYLSTMINSSKVDGKSFIFPELVVGTNYHTSMANALGIFALNVDEINAQSAILGSSIVINFPQVIGVEVIGSFAQAVSISDIKLYLENVLADLNLKGKIVEFYGEGLKNISIEDRAELLTCVKDSGALLGYFSMDENTISYVEQTRGINISFVKEYYEKIGIFNSSYENIEFEEKISLDLSSIKAIVILPKKLDDRIKLDDVSTNLRTYKKGNFIQDNDVVLALISNSCNSLLVQAALFAKNALNLGLKINKNIKAYIILESSLSKQYLLKLDLLKYIEALGFRLLDSFDKEEIDVVERVSLDIEKFNLDTSALNSTDNLDRSFTHPLIKSNWFMSPALVIAYCLTGTMNFNLSKEAISSGIFLSDIWPSISEVNEYLSKVESSIFAQLYKDLFLGNEFWQNIEIQEDDEYIWDKKSSYINVVSSYDNKNHESIAINDAKILALLGDKISIDYISPKGHIPSYSSCALYLESLGLKPDEFNTFESRRANEELMQRAVFSNIKLRNKMVSPKEGGYTKDFDSGELLSIYDFSKRVKEQNRDLVLFAGNDYGIGSFDEWAAKGVKLLGVKAIIAKSFEDSHRSNLVKMGILPLEFIDDDIESLHLKGDEKISIVCENIMAYSKILMKIKKDNEQRSIDLRLRLDNIFEINYFKSGGVLEYLIKSK